MENIILEFKYTKELVKNLYRFTFLPKPKAKFFLGFAPIFIVAVTLMLVLGKGISDPFIVNIFGLIKPILKVLAVAWVFWLFVICIAIFYLPKSASKKNPALQGSFTVIINDEGFAFTQVVNENEFEKNVNAQLQWPAFTMKAENDTLIILYQNKKLYPLPKASFKTDVELQEFRGFLTEQIDIKPKKIYWIALWGRK